jgi:hypothetical protein
LAPTRLVHQNVEDMAGLWHKSVFHIGLLFELKEDVTRWAVSDFAFRQVTHVFGKTSSSLAMMRSSRLAFGNAT